jgi:hypothetical protein
MLTVEDRGLIFDAASQPPERRIAYFTSLCLLESGDLLCGFQNGPSKHSPDSKIGLCRSRDGGRTWTELPAPFEHVLGGVPGSLSGAEVVEASPGKLLLFATWFDRSDRSRPLFDPETEGILKSKQLIAISHDGGDSWSRWRGLDTGELRGTALTGPAVRFPDGRIVFAFESFKEFDDPRPARHGAWLLVIGDGGETFSPPLLLAQDPHHEVYYWDQRLCVGPGANEFVALFWTHDLAKKRDLAVHLRRGKLVGDSLALGPIIDTQIPGQIAAPLWLDERRLLAFVVDRGQPGTMTLWESVDGGKSWPSADKLVVYTHEERAAISQGKENIDFAQYWEDMGKWSFGHPAIRRLPDGAVLLAWYAGSPDIMNLHWARLRDA